MTAARDALLASSPCSTSPSIKEFLGRIAPKFRRTSSISLERRYSWTQTSEKAAVPDLEELPPLEADTKRAHHTLVDLQPCTSHPLTSLFEGAIPADDVRRRPTRGVDAISRNSKVERVIKLSVEPAFVPLPDANIAPQEMTTWSEKTTAVYTARGPNFPRLDRNFLRVYIAEKEMFEHGKLTGISCAPLLPPRRGHTSLVPLCTLGIRHSWNKTYRRRHWQQLSSADFSD